MMSLLFWIIVGGGIVLLDIVFVMGMDERDRKIHRALHGRCPHCGEEL